MYMYITVYIQYISSALGGHDQLRPHWHHQGFPKCSPRPQGPPENPKDPSSTPKESQLKDPGPGVPQGPPGTPGPPGDP